MFKTFDRGRLVATNDAPDSPVEERPASFTNHRVHDLEDYGRIQQYIRMNPVRAKLAARPEAYPYSSAPGVLRLDAVPQGLKPCSLIEASIAAL